MGQWSVCVCVCVCVCVTSWFLKHLPGEAIFAASSPRVIPLSFSLLVLNLIFLGRGGAVENSLTSSEVLSPSVREAPPKTAEGDGKDGTSEPQWWAGLREKRKQGGIWMSRAPLPAPTRCSGDSNLSFPWHTPGGLDFPLLPGPPWEFSDGSFFWCELCDTQDFILTPRWLEVGIVPRWLSMFTARKSCPRRQCLQEQSPGHLVSCRTLHRPWPPRSSVRRPHRAQFWGRQKSRPCARSRSSSPCRRAVGSPQEVGVMAEWGVGVLLSDGEAGRAWVEEAKGCRVLKGGSTSHSLARAGPLWPAELLVIPLAFP